MVDRRAGPGIWALLSVSHSRALVRRPGPFFRAASAAVLDASRGSATGPRPVTQLGPPTGTSWAVPVGTAQWNPTSGTSLPAVESRRPLTVETDR